MTTARGKDGTGGTPIGEAAGASLSCGAVMPSAKHEATELEIDKRVVHAELARRGMSLSALARQMGYTPNALWTGLDRGSLRTRWAIENALGCALFSGRDEYAAAQIVGSRLGRDPRLMMLEDLRRRARALGLGIALEGLPEKPSDARRTLIARMAEALKQPLTSK